MVLCFSVLLALVGSGGCTVDFSDQGGRKSGLDAALQDVVQLGDGSVNEGGVDLDGGLDASNPCGNGIIDDGEECDGEEFGGRTCATESGFGGGSLVCTENCRVDASMCHDCGDGVIEGPEECEEGDFRGRTCASLTGMADGSLVCDSDCHIDDSGCYECGDGLVTGPEECDDGAQVGGDGCSASCTVEPGFGCSGEPTVCGCTVYVSAAGPASGHAEDGTSWANAFANLMEGVQAARDLLNGLACREKVMVWIARGTYRLNDKIRTLSGMELYGGFAGGETLLERRTLDASVTVISPDSTYSGLLVHVGTDRDVVIDSLTFDAGRGRLGTYGTPGALLVDSGSDARVSHCRFTNNSGQDGGAGLVDDSVLLVSDTLFENNQANGEGGALYVTNGGSLQVSGSTFRSNQSSRRGGAISVRDGRSFLVRDGCLFESNRVSGRGGALSIKDVTGDVTFVGVTFRGNESTSDGAALYVDGGGFGPFIILRSVFIDNHWDWSSDVGGGGLVSMRLSDGLVVQDGLVVGNGPLNQYAGPLFYADRTGGELVNVTLSGNHAESPLGWNGVVVNSILWGNEWIEINSRYECRFSVLEDVGLCQSTERVLVATDPLFVGPNGGDYHLQANSPAIDAADGDMADASDLERNPRVDVPNVGNTGIGQPSYVDMGAYEYQP